MTTQTTENYGMKPIDEAFDIPFGKVWAALQGLTYEEAFKVLSEVRLELDASIKNDMQKSLQKFISHD